MLRLVRAEWALWRSLSLSERPLGKYVVLYACIIHIGWAALFVCCPVATESTPVHIIAQVFGGRYRGAIVLFAVAVVALGGMRYRARHPDIVGIGPLVALLPQQAVLLMSAFAGILAVIEGHYVDGVMRVWPFILSDQLPIIMTGFLYSVVVIEVAVDQ